jgi:hypothetical protein
MRISQAKREKIEKDLETMWEIAQTLRSFSHKKGCNNVNTCPRFCCRRTKTKPSRFLNFGTSITWVIAMKLENIIDQIRGYYLRGYFGKASSTREIRRELYVIEALNEAYENDSHLFPKAQSILDKLWAIVEDYE